ncbi:4499_t:CDS:2 [Dentiscutata erythropus]|uniref:4499_t:CDS:1 n=1 Tax=Dentiscutata erythropus TaxID=1348616 RepID=A0A9N9HTX9_9GLOM|nr:4499_t:CDS:2 [Dentiscutata erythropus]
MLFNKHLNGIRGTLLLFLVLIFVKFSFSQTVLNTPKTSAGTETLTIATSTNIITHVPSSSKVTSIIVTTQVSIPSVVITTTTHASTTSVVSTTTTQASTTSVVEPAVAQVSTTSVVEPASTTSVVAPAEAQVSTTSVVTPPAAQVSTTSVVTPATAQTPAVPTGFTTSGTSVTTTTTETTIQEPTPNPGAPKSNTSSSYNPPGKSPTLPPTEATTIINQCTNNTMYCHIDTNTKVTGKIFTSTATDQKITLTPSYEKTITKFTITTFIQTITQVYPGYTTTITTNINGVESTYETYYPPSTLVVMQTVTASVPAIEAGQSSNIGINFRDYNGLVNIIWSLWIIIWSLVYMILT